MSGRTYDKMTPEERHRDRRQRLLDAGFHLFARDGYHAVGVREVCAHATTSQRSFYAHFTSIEDLLAHVYQRCAGDAVDVLREAARLDTGDPTRRLAGVVGAYILHVTMDPRRAHIMHREVHRTPHLAGAARRMAGDLADVLHLAADTTAGRLVAVAVAGAIDELVVTWMRTPGDQHGISRITAAAVTVAQQSLSDRSTRA
ncbi:TetR/AcrR family transcriptional regulator [Sphaerisporangium album]|uniref:TetR/AcrR family transcriptional regulator n=1 Tax=Sphaerisporangium album TaxID=509200 RepID=A0A367EJI3_9ACTN|nr:TetR/AcrR family transcriptional regulator [Sphaerisporangium album]RCG17785.1 TetR/AcrR family transcriptional regulator [Sphaerisporangium album]